MSAPLIHADAIVRAVMDAHPETIAVFSAGVCIAQAVPCRAFLTVGEAAASYATETAELLDNLRAAVAAAAARGRP